MLTAPLQHIFVQPLPTLPQTRGRKTEDKTEDLRATTNNEYRAPGDGRQQMAHYRTKTKQNTVIIRGQRQKKVWSSVTRF